MVPDPKQHILRHLREGNVHFTLHAQQEMVNDDVSVDEILDALNNCEVVENYPEHERGACCLVCGKTFKGRYLHVVCTTSLPYLVIITTYEPSPPKWITPFKRGRL